ncbi:dTDP-glucose 4,6-dehydratase [Actinomadura sp. RB99]|uniref:NAD-dependent epimerase/dehydratase family protein n=1 Tax=Actinomadura sp. RB99 TaxID=2691577 RepID=UPI001682DFDC|nr:NAD-dependent epimerase/dehydratase family protein [Actinomadura sp. RB99]MBD2895620.1 dTDP-glucose 4,6-dehydratase [Actinomadura sp. RB99]
MPAQPASSSSPSNGAALTSSWRRVDEPLTTPLPGTVLVTGVCGFIGSHLALALLKRGVAVVGVDARPVNACPLTSGQLRRLYDYSGFRLLTAKVADPEVANALYGVDTVVHLAAATDVAASWGAGFSAHATSVLETQRLLDGCASQQVPRVVVASSSHVYGPACGGIAREDQPVEPTSPYGVSKLAAERLALAYARRPGSTLNAVALRFFTAFGPGCNPAMVVPRLFNAACTGQAMPLFGDGNALHTWTYVSDLVDAVIRAAEVPMRAGSTEVVNVAGADQASLIQVADLVGEITGRRVALEPYGERAGDAAGTRADLTRAGRVLGFVPQVRLREGLVRMWQHMSSDPSPSSGTSASTSVV